MTDMGPIVCVNKRCMTPSLCKARTNCMSGHLREVMEAVEKSPEIQKFRDDMAGVARGRFVSKGPDLQQIPRHAGTETGRWSAKSPPIGQPPRPRHPYDRDFEDMEIPEPPTRGIFELPIDVVVNGEIHMKPAASIQDMNNLFTLKSFAENVVNPAMDTLELNEAMREYCEEDARLVQELSNSMRRRPTTVTTILHSVGTFFISLGYSLRYYNPFWMAAEMRDLRAEIARLDNLTAALEAKER